MAVPDADADAGTDEDEEDNAAAVVVVVIGAVDDDDDDEKDDTESDIGKMAVAMREVGLAGSRRREIGELARVLLTADLARSRRLFHSRVLVNIYRRERVANFQ